MSARPGGGLCKARFLRKADLGTPHSMWISLGQDLNGRFSLADKQRLLAQRIHTFLPIMHLSA
jgi:hypothetical protein